MTESLPCNIKRLILGLFIFSGFICSLFSQTRINGVINKYGRVTSVGVDKVIVGDEAQFGQFAAGDTVLLIQMKGVRIYSYEAGAYGIPDFSYGPSGMHEFLMIESVNDGTNEIVFRNNIVHSTFNVGGEVQIIKVPSYNNALVDATLTSIPWDSINKTGGVVSLIAGNTLTLNADIDVSGKGFWGGSSNIGTGLCINTNAARFDKYAFHRDSLNSGFKGESPVSRGWLDASTFPAIHPGYAKGKGYNLLGGGGGNGKFSGGGGGSNYGAGGKGGREMATCSSPLDGGLGGAAINPTYIVQLDTGLFLGGGGGSSTYWAGSAASAGGNGGGIVIIVCDTIKGNNRSIIANGSGAAAASGPNAGAGGGGGGGSIALYLRSYSTSNLTISANGGRGGNNPGTYGEGGGGGGGLVNTSNITIPSNVIRTVTGGLAGSRTGVVTAGNGTSGSGFIKFVPILNGFLFNSIRSSVTGDQTDSICSDVVPKPITGTSPVGGSGSYTYLWQKSYNLAGPPTDITPSNVLNYSPSSTEPAGDVWFRRIVTDNITSLTDTSKWVHIIVQPAITGNLVGKDTVICNGQNPLSLIPLNSGPSNGNGIYSYQWLQNLTNTNWATSPDASGTSNLASYDPPALTDTTYYQRVVTSGRCISFSSTATVTVLPLITGNIISRPDSVICEGSLFIPLSASAPGGGAGAASYTYQWQDSAASVSGNWLPASGVNTGQNHTPDTSKFTSTDTLRYFRRVVYSGADNVCKSYSSPIRLTRYSKIINNSISADNTICSGTIPVPLTGTSPLQGSLIYTYIWQDSIRNGSWINRGTNGSLSFTNGLTDTTWYRRIVNSSKCTSKSNMLVINVHKPIANNTISLLSGAPPDTTLCNGAVPNLLKGGTTPPTGGTGIPGSYAYQWSSSPDNSTWTDISTSGTSIDYQPVALNTSTYFRRRVTSGQCSDESGVITINILPLIQNNAIAADQTICRDEAPDIFTQASGPGLSGGAGTYSYSWLESPDLISWNPAAGTNNSSNGTYQAPALTDPMHYRRIVRSGANGCCIDTSGIIDIAIDVLPPGFTYSAGPDIILHSFDYLYELSADPLVPGATGRWSMAPGFDTVKIESGTNNVTKISELLPGLNRFVWTVTLGACIRSDMVDVNVLGIVVPEGFSPNNDGINDIFEILGLDPDRQVAELTIVNSAGTEVFTTTNRNKSEWAEWDGKTSGGDDLPEGTYYYLLKLTSKGNPSVFKKSGFIILKRY